MHRGLCASSFVSSVLGYSFVSAEKSHRCEIDNFECADPPTSQWDRARREHVHPCQWELVAQKGIRSLRPPCYESAGEHMSVTLDATGRVAAVVASCVSTEGTEFVIRSIGCRCDLRNTGVGRFTLMSSIVDILDWRSRKHSDISLLYSRIHPENVASRALFHSAGFTLVPGAKEDFAGEMDYWALDLTSLG